MPFLFPQFPTYAIRNIKLYYWLGIFFNGWFVLPNWVFYFSKYISRTEIGIVEGIAILVGIIMEVPSGVIADLLGKKRTIIIGSIFQFLSCLIIILAHQFWQFLVGNILMFVGFAFQSGALEAFAYDSLKEKSQSHHYDVVIAKQTGIAIFTTVLATAIGGLLYAFNPSYPYYAWAIFIFISILILSKTTEPKVDTYTFTVTNYFRQLKEGIAGLFGKKLRTYLLPILAISILIKLYQGLVRQSMAAAFSFNGETFGYLLSVILIPGALVSFNFDRLRQYFGEKKLLILTLVAYALAFVLALLTRNIFVGGVIFLIIMLTERIAEPLTSVLINHRIDSKHRATILSTKALFAQIPYIILVLGFAQYTLPDKLNILFLIYIILIFTSLFHSLLFINRKR